ncbi:hypothetical protein BGX20_004525 [Mortierella sp. AD010]|nr:hypothetical protein BGX20_004525 [Mortierella sp. AD010]
MTSFASSKGDVGAEMLSSQIGAYFDIAIRIIEYHGGDVVKFLGDALLVVFQADPSPENLPNSGAHLAVPKDDFDSNALSQYNPKSTVRRDRVTVRKAIECSQELLARLSDYRIYLSEREFSRKFSCSSSGSDDNTNEDWSSSNNPFTSVTNTVQGNNSGNGSATPRHAGSVSGHSVFHPFAFHNSTTSLGHSGSSSPRRSSLNDASNPPQSKNVKGSHTHGAHSLNGKDLSSIWHISGHISGSGFRPVPSVQTTAPSTNNSEQDLTLSSKPTTGAAEVPTFQRPREDSVASASSKTGSTSSKKTKFFTSAFSRLTQSYTGERHSGIVAETMSEGGIVPDDSFDLQLHMALSAGDISNIIIGDIGDDYGLDDLLIQNTGRLEYAICGEQMATIEEALSLAHAGEITITQSAWEYTNPESRPKSEARENCFILKGPGMSASADVPLMRRIRNEKQLNTPVRCNPHYYKYLNKSAIHRLILYPDGAFPAQFRNATILFVSLGDVKPWTQEGLVLCQKVMHTVQQIISTYEGFIQQFAVDDKGATLLCAFGLPYPRSHENEAIFAAKTAWLIQQELLRENISGFKISLATGVIFTSSIGNEFRRDPAIVGDTIVIAVRILKFDYAKKSIVCDESTMLACTANYDGLCEFEYMGEEHVKGKSHPLQVWRLAHFGAERQAHRPDDITIEETTGYEAERDKVFNFIDSWSRNPNKNTILVMGPRGSGKSLFYQHVLRVAENHEYLVCSARTAEVEQITEYFPVRFLLLSFFGIMHMNEIPYGYKSTPGVGADVSATLSNMTMNSDPSVYSSEPRSPVICQYGETFGDNQTGLTKLQALISVCLDKMGDSGECLPMPELDRIISAISSENSSFIMKEEDDNLLADFVVSMLNYASRFVKIIIILEDTQWSDFKTLNLLKVIHERCLSVLIVLFSRPQRDYGCSNVFSTITNHPKHLEVVLEGLKRWEIEQTLLRAFKSNGVNRISPEIMELVVEQTKGNPKFVKNMSLMLREFCHVNIVDGELMTTGKSAASSCRATEEKLLKQDRKKVTLMQYDRIRPKFQDFLKIASCLSEKFSLAEVAAIKPLESLLGRLDSRNSCARIISELDTFKFLSLATEQQTNIQFSSNVILQAIYTFRSPPTSHDIYESIPYEERVGYHLKMAQFYESFLEQQEQSEDPTKLPLNCQDLLPQISNHYLKTDVTEKKIKYLKALAAYHLKSNMLTDTTDNVNELIKIIDTDQCAKGMVSEEDLADIYGMKGESLSRRMRIEEAEPALMDSLAKYGIIWPTSKGQWKRELIKENLKFKYHYHRGSIPVVQKSGKSLQKFKDDPRMYLRLTRIIGVLSCIQNIYYWTRNSEAAMLSSLYTLKYSRKLGAPSGDQTAALGRIAILHYFHGNKHEYERYMKDARRANDAGETTGGMLEAMEAYVEYNEGRYNQAHRLLDDAINESKSFGVVTHLASFYRAVTQKAAYRIWEGAFNAHPDDWQLLRMLSTVSLQNGDSEGETLFAIPTVASLIIQDRMREAESWVFLMERFLLPKARVINLAVAFAVLAFYYAKMKSYQRSRIYIDLVSQKIAEQDSGAHPFPLMSCMLNIMAMYEVFNTAYYALGHTLPGTTPISQTRGDAILVRMITYLQTDSFKIIANPLICLGEALRCFLMPGHRKEGSMKLTRGYQEMKSSMDGVVFVKAFFLCQLGRYSAPELKYEYYSQAHNLFHSMGIDSAVWLNEQTPLWRPPQVEENQSDTTTERAPSPISSVQSERGDDIEWGEPRNSIDSGDSRRIAPLDLPPLKIPVASVAKTKDNEVDLDMILNSSVELDEYSFDTELARASISSGSTVHTMDESSEQGEIMSGAATPA